MPTQGEITPIPSTGLRQPDGKLLPVLLPIAEQLRQAKAVVFFDLDKTALDDRYNPINLEGITRVISSLQNKGVIIGIHSDTPRQSLLQFAKIFGVKGPLIYELAGIHFQEQDLDIVLDVRAMEFFRGFRNRFFEEALKRFPDSADLKNFISKTIDRNKEKREGVRYPGYDRGLFINPYRLLSFGLWAEGVTKATGETYINPEFHQRVDALAKELLMAELGYSDEGEFRRDYDYDFSPEYGVTIVKKRVLSSKTPPIQHLLTLVEGYQKPIIMIGDSGADFIDDPRVITFGVANSKPELKEKLQEVTTALPFGLKTNLASKTYTDGLIELLSVIDQVVN